MNYHLKRVEFFLRKCRTVFTSDVKFHSNRLWKATGYFPDLASPTTLNEKICHRLVYDRNDFYTLLADKLAVRDYVHARTTRVKTAPLIGIYRNAEDIDIASLPEQFVLKCNHDSGSTIVCTNKSTFNHHKALNKLKLALKKNMYYTTREWQYKNIPPVILCEHYIDIVADNDKNTTPEMLRIHCFHGEVSFIEADFTDENGKGFVNVYDQDWRLQPFQMEYPNTPDAIPEPALFYQAILAAQALANGIDYCRVDLMLTKDDIYFSEITLSPRRGKLTITPAEWDATLGKRWRLAPVMGRPA
ncbi:Putative sugar transferase [Cronobacter condimenti 1330]|nr:Putative sugar transferase [Cronobacter condimenti 1330]